VTSRTAARRYARALFDVALKEQSDLAEVERQLAAFATLFEQHESMAKVLLNPAVPAPRKRGAVAQILKLAPAVPALDKLLLLLAERDRLAILPELVEAYRERLLDHQKVVRAELTTALPLAADRAQQIRRSLEHVTGRTVQVSTRVDSSIVGGLVARIGSTVYDASVTSQLERMRRRLTERV
jgi:F-type H+-transporting ATPase subunit delta